MGADTLAALAEDGAPHGSAWQALDARAGTVTTTDAVCAGLLTPTAPGSAVPLLPRSVGGLPAEYSLFFLDDELVPQHYQHGVSQERQRDKAIPRLKAPHFILI